MISASWLPVGELAVVFGGMLACSPSPHRSPSSRADADIPADDLLASDPRTAELGDPDLPPDPSCPTGRWVNRVHGRLHAEDSTPIGDGFVGLCVTEYGSPVSVCLPPARSGPDGSFVVILPPGLRCLARASVRAYFARGTTYCPIDVTGTTGTVVLPNPIAIYQVPSELTVDAAQTDPMTVPLAAGALEITLVPDDVIFYDAPALGARSVAPTHPGLCFLEASVTYDGLFALYPEGEIRPLAGAAFRVANSTALSAGTPVDWYALGGISCTVSGGGSIAEGALGLFGTGTVSADGATISGTGLPCLTWLAYTVAP